MSAFCSKVSSFVNIFASPTAFRGGVSRGVVFLSHLFHIGLPVTCVRAGDSVKPSMEKVFSMMLFSIFLEG